MSALLTREPVTETFSARFFEDDGYIVIFDEDGSIVGAEIPVDEDDDVEDLLAANGYEITRRFPSFGEEETYEVVV